MPVMLATLKAVREDGGSKPTQAKMFTRLHLNKKKLSVMTCTCHSSYCGIKRRVSIQANLDKK
jgi:hypothetical protein